MTSPKASLSPSGFDENGERLSLLDQLKLNKGEWKYLHISIQTLTNSYPERKHLELQQQQHSQNSQYKLDEASAQFYESLRQSTLQHDENERSQIQRQLQQFRSTQNNAKAASPTDSDASAVQQPIPDRKIRVTRLPGNTSASISAVDPLETKDDVAYSDPKTAEISGTTGVTAAGNLAKKIIEGYSSSDEEWWVGLREKIDAREFP